MKPQTHTPTRTIATPVSLVQGENRATMIDVNGKAIGDLRPWLLEDEQESIVRAVNAHEELLASLREYKEAALNGTEITLGMARRSAAAIAKAEGK